MTIRTFIALDLPEFVLNRIIELRDSFFENVSDLKWESRNKLHITLKFLGDTDENLIPDISRSLADLADRYSPFSLKISKAGLFYRNGKPAILYLDFLENEYLLRFHEEIENIMENFGFKKENRKFKTHLTLLRIKNDRHLNRIKNFTKLGIDLPEFISDEITLYRSILKPAGSVYQPIESFKLNNRRNNGA
ncbi:2'-5' RNA ligase [Melioribacter roseus P3M-2]|uniref:RNA 2',3'-cyclic phosphodiesterase n=1 Tax=Melioribacter roseus (strain DSM 23840 / JCM 17771 / VKM B-2668 / P3M-2) TaxID=1191523 RepID=I6Z941_MELRP|nr:RNA 2',3'-cyclic phosphodiesterase [Melioribacter roseus]AFN75665.1 2'-5' RNA ligase [Melioribacter roseus P3M-2]